MSTAIKLNVQFLFVRLECAPGAAAAWTWTVARAKRTSEDKVRVKYIVSMLGSFEKCTPDRLYLISRPILIRAFDNQRRCVPLWP
jgi:hypothetical protein